MRLLACSCLLFTLPLSAHRRIGPDITVGAAVAGGVDSLLNIGQTIHKMRAAAKMAKRGVKKVAKKIAGK